MFELIIKKPLTVSDFSAVVTGLLLALNLPPKAPLWVGMIGGVFAILVVKMLFGGLGKKKQSKKMPLVGVSHKQDEKKDNEI